MHNILVVLLAAWILVPVKNPALPGAGQIQPDQGCSVLYATDGEVMLGGNNEDYFNPLTKVWFIPGEAGSFGRVYFGFSDYHAQGGMNEQGLFFDGLGLDTAIAVSKEGKQEYAGNLVDKAMAECATVQCVVGLFEQYYTNDSWAWQFLFGDAHGESAIIEAQEILRQRGGYQVATNFVQSTTPPEARTCWRYQTATEELESIETLSVEAVRDVLDAVHLDGPASTLYSNVYDLKNRLVYLYYFYDYDNVVILDLEEELARGYHAYDLPSLFPANPAADAWAQPKLRQYERAIASRADDSPDPAILAAYAGTYEMPEGWGAPDQTLTVIAQERSLLLRFPDYRQHELFPESTTDFFHVAFLDSEFRVAYETRFGLDQERRVEHLELVFGSESIFIERLGPESFLPEVVPTPEPTATPQSTITEAPTTTPTSTATQKPATPVPTSTRAPAATPIPTATTVTAARVAPSAMIVEAVPDPVQPDEGVEFPWGWLLMLLAIGGVAAGSALLRKWR